MFQIGDKVVPVNKTFEVEAFGALHLSSEWSHASGVGQEFLYVVRKNLTDHKGRTIPYLCSTEPHERTGDFFNESDLTPYVEVKKAKRTRKVRK